MPIFITKNIYSGQAFTANETKYSPVYSAADVGLTGHMSYQYDVTGAITVTLQRLIVDGSSDWVDVDANAISTATGIKDVPLLLARFYRFKFVETAGAAATMNKFSVIFG